MDKINLISDAILLGSKGTTQAFDVLRDRHGETCALGAALEAIGVDLAQPTIAPPPDDTLRERWPNLYRPYSKACPVDRCYDINVRMYGVMHLIVHLNDHHRWPRETIAQWLRQNGY